MPGSDLQLSFGGLVTGAGTPYRIRTITGLRDFTVRSTDDSTATRWGSFVGGDQVESASIQIEYVYANDPDVTRALEVAFSPAVQSIPSALQEMGWKWPGEVELVRYARCRRRQRAMSYQSERTNGPVSMLVELQAPDPRAYSAAVHQDVVSPFSDDSLSFDLTEGTGTSLGTDLDAGAGGDLGINMAGTGGAGTVFVSNAGNTDTWPTVTFRAPGGMSHWRLHNLWTGQFAEFVFALGPGQEMVVDFAAKATPKTGDVVTVDGAARYAAWIHPRAPLAFPAGVSELRLDVLDGDETNALALVEWRDAFL